MKNAIFVLQKWPKVLCAPYLAGYIELARYIEFARCIKLAGCIVPLVVAVDYAQGPLASIANGGVNVHDSDRRVVDRIRQPSSLDWFHPQSVHKEKHIFQKRALTLNSGAGK